MSQRYQGQLKNAQQIGATIAADAGKPDAPQTPQVATGR